MAKSLVVSYGCNKVPHGLQHRTLYPNNCHSLPPLKSTLSLTLQNQNQKPLSLKYNLLTTLINRRVSSPITAAVDSDVPHPLHQGSVKLRSSKSFEQWDSLTAKFAGASNIPFLLMQLPQIILNARNLLAGNKTALLAVPWLGMFTGLLGNLSLLSYFTKKREKEVIVVQTLGVVSQYVVFLQLAMAEAMPLPYFLITSVVVTAGLILNFTNYFNLLNAGIWRFWEDFITVGGLSVLPQIMWSTFVPYIPNSILPGAIAFVIAVMAVIMARMGKLSEEGVKFVGGISGWTATLLFMWMPVSQMWTNFLNPDNIRGLSAFTMLLAMMGNGLMIPRALFTRRKLSIKPIDHQYISQVLSRKDWFLLLNHEVKVGRIILNPQFVVSLLQNQENPLHPLKFYIWVSNIDPSFAKNHAVRGVLAKTLYRNGPVVLSVELLQDIRNSGFRVSEDLLVILIGSWGRLGLAKYCAEVFGQISFLGLSPTTRLYNAVIDALVKSNSLDLAYLKFQQMTADNCNPDRFTYNILIHGVCKIGVVDEGLRLVKQMEVLGYSPNVFTYTILIDGFCNAKRADEAFRLIDMMKERNVSPSDATIRSLVHGVFRCVAPNKAFELLSRFVKRELVLSKLAYDTILYCLSNKSMAREAAMFLRSCGAKGYLPDSSLFNITMACLIKGLDLNETCEIFRSFIEQGVKPGFNTYLALIEATYKAGRSHEGNCFLDQMVKNGLVSNVFCYNMVINCFCKENKMERASETFRDMQHRGIAPNIVTFNTLISGYCRDGDMCKARELMVMLLERGYKPDIFTFNSIIDGLCRVHQIGDAFACFTEMVEWGVTPNAVTYNILIRSLCIIGDVTRSIKLLRKMQANGIDPDTFSVNALIQSFCRLNKLEKAEKLFNSMMTIGLNPDNYTYSTMIKAFCECGRVDEAKEMFHSMEANGCLPDSYTCNLMLETLVRLAHFEEARNLVKMCSEMGISLKSNPNL